MPYQLLSITLIQIKGWKIINISKRQDKLILSFIDGVSIIWHDLSKGDTIPLTIQRNALKF